MGIVNESFGMQQARLLFSDAKLTGKQQYEIEKNYPEECSRVFQELAIRDGWIQPDGIVRKISLFINEHFSKKITEGNPLKPLATCVISVSIIGLFFFPTVTALIITSITISVMAILIFFLNR